MNGPDLSGKRFGMLVAIEKIHHCVGLWMWKCQCNCGKSMLAHSTALKSGKVKSCGCFRRSRLGMQKRTHGMTGSPEYVSWCSMKARCFDPSNNRYKDYGARGISVCASWKESFEKFFSDMGNKPSARHTLGRINNELGYSPENCRWETYTEQARNRRKSSWRVKHTDEGRARISAARKKYWEDWRVMRAAG